MPPQTTSKPPQPSIKKEGKPSTPNKQGGGKAKMFVQESPSILITDELDKAIAHCRAKVERIAKQCRARNRKFR